MRSSQRLKLFQKHDRSKQESKGKHVILVRTKQQKPLHTEAEKAEQLNNPFLKSKGKLKKIPFFLRVPLHDSTPKITLKIPQPLIVVPTFQTGTKSSRDERKFSGQQIYRGRASLCARNRIGEPRDHHLVRMIHAISILFCYVFWKPKRIHSMGK